MVGYPDHLGTDLKISYTFLVHFHPVNFASQFHSFTLSSSVGPILSQMKVF